ncbi:multimerin-2a isoform X2 [Simochromis diagramma]|uniref:multimerin-2a isoform X2 n=1 Tax=Simochromis diagramma TaxID=43689 RepID=UPI001A7EF853|nr:multimerin-2a isoform X2 [Simochromis diagramma]
MNECRSHLLIRYKHRAGPGRRRRGNVTKPFPPAEETGGVTSSLPSSFSLLQLFKTGWHVSHTDADMTAVGELVLVLGLLVSAHCEVRARDPEVEEEEGELGGGGGGGGVFPPHPRTTETSPLGETGSNPARSGNWCPFVHNHVQTMAVMCGTEKYTIKSQSPCPSGTPDCHLTMYKLSTRPIYRQQQKIVTALLWRCCPGHGGHNCEDTVSGPRQDSESSTLIGRSEAGTSEVKAPVVHTRPQQRGGDLNHEQNDHQVPDSTLYDASYPSSQDNDTQPTPGPGHAHKRHHTSYQATNTHNHDRHPHHLDRDHPQQEHRTPEDLSAAPLPYPGALIPLIVPYMMDRVWSQLQPVMERFNHSLEHLSQRVGDLAHDVAQLKSSQLGAGHQMTLQEERDDGVEERLDARLDEVIQNIGEVKRQVEAQQTEMEKRLHSQHVMLHYNLTSFKADIDVKLKRQQKTLQVSLQAMNATLTGLKLDQWEMAEDEQDQDDLHPPTNPPHQLPPPTDASELWDAIDRLDNTVVNNTVKVTTLMEDAAVTSRAVQQLSRHVKELEKQINDTARRTQVVFMETGLEVEDAKVKVLNYVKELAGKLSQQVKRLDDVEEDMDCLWTIPNACKNNSRIECNCESLQATVAILQRDLANVTELANENRLALDDNSRGGHWGTSSDWEPAVKALQLGLHREQSRIRTLDLGLTHLNASVSGLKHADRQQDAKIKVLDTTFNILLQDASRHSRVLKMLLGDEVIDFLKMISLREKERPDHEDEEEEEADFISVQALKEDLRHLQEQLREHEHTIIMLKQGQTGGREEVPSADQPPSWLPGDPRRGGGDGLPAREQQMLFHPGDGGDLWNLERKVEEVERRLSQLEEKTCSCPNVSRVAATVMNEVTWLKKGLEQHLGVFKNVFSNADVLARSNATLELDKLWQLLKKKEKKKQGGRREESERGGKRRSRRESPGEPVPASLSERAPLFVARSLQSVSGVVVFEPSLTQGQFYSGSTFTVPVDGIYLFVLTLHLRPGPAHVVLRSMGEEEEKGGAWVPLQRQEVSKEGPATGVSLLLLREGQEVRLELRGGDWAESEDNMFACLLLYPTT